jgi:histidine phosphotransferase ChpT
MMSGDRDGPEMGLIGDSVGSASARIRFFRIAFGSAGEQLVGPAEVTAILRDLYHGSRVDIRWTLETPQPRALVRLSLLAMMCLETAMPYSGTIQLNEDRNGWILSGSADRINSNPDLWGLLVGGPSETKLQPAHVQFALLPLTANEYGHSLQTSLTDSLVKIRF